jgi:hypothetical protein
MAVCLLRRCIQERLQMLVDHAIQHAVLGGAGLIRGKVGHADDVNATSRRQQCREMDMRHGWGRARKRGQPARYQFQGTSVTRGLTPLDPGECSIDRVIE